MTPARRDPRALGLLSGQRGESGFALVLPLGIKHTRLRPVVEVLPREGGWACRPGKASTAWAGRPGAAPCLRRPRPPSACGETFDSSLNKDVASL